MPQYAGLTVIGHLGADPVMKAVGSGELCEFSVAVTKKKNNKEITNWFRVSVWGKQSQACMQYLSKGSAVFVEGDFQAREYEKDGEKRYSLDVFAKTVQFLGGAEKPRARHTEEYASEETHTRLGDQGIGGKD